MNTQNQYRPQSRPHPGETLTEKLQELGMGPKEFALRTCKPEKTIIAVMQGDSSLTPDMAVLFERVTGIPVAFWLNHQRAYDEYVARERYKSIIRDSVTWARRFPLTDMIKNGWLQNVRTIEERTIALLAFFGIASHEVWNEYYCNQKLKTTFRISLAHSKEPYAVSAWLRQGELQAREVHSANYSEEKFRVALSKIRVLMSKRSAGYFDELQRICKESGVKVVHTPCINKAPINGATRWLGNTPLIQLSDRYKRNETFWFTFFHEAGHILLHGKKDVFLENLEYSDMDAEKEREADAFAKKYMATSDE